MPAKNPFSADRVGMVDAFFAEQDARLVEELRQRNTDASNRQELARLSGITDEDLLAKFIELEIDSETIVALQLVPLIEVAWADGTLDDKERAAILKAAEARGVKPDTAEHKLLDGWLNAKPADEMLDTWMRYTADICSTLDPAERDTLKHELLDRAQAVAEASGGFLGLTSKVSAHEHAMLIRLGQAFDPAEA